ncbi:MAG: hypothetical protein V4719_14640 [Planctomycetota bacterium]
MRPFLEFQAIVETRVKPPEFDEVIAAKLDTLRRLRPEIDDVPWALTPKDLRGKIGAGYELTVSGTMFFKPGSVPTLQDIDSSGNECFEHGFESRPMFYLDTSSSTATSFPIRCRKCQSVIGQSVNHIQRVILGQIAEQNAEMRASAIAHLQQAHPEIDSATLIF